MEPGKKVYDQSLTNDIKMLKDDKFVIAGQSDVPSELRSRWTNRLTSKHYIWPMTISRVVI